MKKGTLLKDITVSALEGSSVGVFYEKAGDVIPYSRGCCVGGWYTGFMGDKLPNPYKGLPYAVVLHPRSTSDFEFLKGCLPSGTHKFVHRIGSSTAPTIIIPDDSMCGKTLAVIYQTLRQEAERFHLVREPLMDYLCEWAGEDSEKRRWVLALLGGVSANGHSIFLETVLDQFLYCLLCDELYGLGQKEYETGAVSNYGAGGDQGWAFVGNLFKDFNLSNAASLAYGGTKTKVQELALKKYKKSMPHTNENSASIQAQSLLIRGAKSKWGTATDFYEELYGLFGDVIKQAKEELGAAATREEREGIISRLLVGLGRN